MRSLFETHMSNPYRHIIMILISLALHAGLIIHLWRYEPAAIMGTGAVTNVVNVQIFSLKKVRSEKTARKRPVPERTNSVSLPEKPGRHKPQSTPGTQSPEKADLASDTSIAIAPSSEARPTEAEGFQNYASRIWQKIAERGSGGIHVEGIVVISFSLNVAGEIRTLHIAQSSGNEALDALALDRIKTAAPFGPAPANISEADLVFDVPIHFR